MVVVVQSFYKGRPALLCAAIVYENEVYTTPCCKEYNRSLLSTLKIICFQRSLSYLQRYRKTTQRWLWSLKVGLRVCTAYPLTVVALVIFSVSCCHLSEDDLDVSLF